MVKLVDVATVVAGQSPKGDNLNKEKQGMPFYQGKKDYGIKFLKPPSVWTKVVTKVAEKGDLLLSVRAPVGALNFATQEICIGRGLAAIRVKKEINKDYLYYVLSNISNVLNVRSGAIFNSISKKQIEDINFYLPSLQEQKRIVTKIDSAYNQIDKFILLNESRINKIEVLKSIAISSLLNNLDKGKRMKLKEVASYVKKNAKKSGLPYLGLENIQANTMELTGDITVPDQTSSTFEFNENYVLYGRLRPYLKKVLVPEFKGQCSTEIFCIQPNKNLLKKYLAFWLIEASIARKIELSSTGARMPRANMNLLLDFEINIPSLDEQSQIISKLDKTFEFVKKLKLIHFKLKENLKSLKSKILEVELASSN